jgi:hypothetical protein
VASENREVLKKLGSNFKKDCIIEKPYESMVTSLNKYCGKHKRPPGDLIKIVEENGLNEPILRIFNTFFKEKMTKQCTYWHYGAPNTGKTKIYKLL